MTHLQKNIVNCSRPLVPTEQQIVSNNKILRLIFETQPNWSWLQVLFLGKEEFMASIVRVRSHYSGVVLESTAAFVQPLNDCGNNRFRLPNNNKIPSQIKTFKTKNSKTARPLTNFAEATHDVGNVFCGVDGQGPSATRWDPACGLFFGLDCSAAS